MTDADLPSPPPAKQAKTDATADDVEEGAGGVGSLRTEAMKRKERLIQLRNQAQTKGLPNTSVITEDGELPKPIFRNYKPISEELKDGQLPEGSMIDCELMLHCCFMPFLPLHAYLTLVRRGPAN